jgi:hypothetical protein
MKITIKYIDSDIPKENHEFYTDFIKYLQKIKPLKDNITIKFVGEREGDMTTGQRNTKNELLVLSKNRMNRDILRTLAHEWVHEYQRTILNRDKGPDIGGKNEDEANSESGSIIKKYEKSHPNNEKKMYE